MIAATSWRFGLGHFDSKEFLNTDVRRLAYHRHRGTYLRVTDLPAAHGGPLGYGEGGPGSNFGAAKDHSRKGARGAKGIFQ